MHSFPAGAKKTGAWPGCQEGLAADNLLLPLMITMTGRRVSLPLRPPMPRSPDELVIF
jgi:hypothetical protein